MRHLSSKTPAALRAAMMAMLLAACLPQRAAAQSGKDLYGADVYWNATPNDVNNLLKGMKAQTDANFQMDIRTWAQISDDPEKNPVLFRSGHYRFSYTPAERAKLRKYLLAGGMIIYNTGLGSKPFYDSVVAELKLIFPEQQLVKIPMTHPIFSTVFKIPNLTDKQGKVVQVEGIEINGRLVMVYSRDGLNDVGNAKGCCCCGGNMITESAQVNVNAFTYALLY